jgi:hypothetical protein
MQHLEVSGAVDIYTYIYDFRQQRVKTGPTVKKCPRKCMADAGTVTDCLANLNE